MADEGARRARVAAELVFLRRLPPLARVAVVLIVGGGCVALGCVALTLQHQYATHNGGGRIASLLAHGSTVLTAWEGWAAALFFLVALVRLRRGVPEPPAGRTPVEQLSLGQIRAGLVREYTLVRIGLVVVGLVSLIDAARAARYAVAAITGDQLARTALAATLVEAVGLVIATVVLALWAATFRVQLDRVGALG